MSEPIKINFCDMSSRLFDYDDNFILDIIKKRFGEYEISDKPDFLFYSAFGTDHLRFDDCVKVFITDEAVTPEFNECDYAMGFDWITFEDRYIRRPVWFGEERFYNNRMSITDEEALSRKFCNFVYFNDFSGRGSIFRQEFVKKLSEYKRVDCPGKVLNNMKSDKLSYHYDGDWRKSKIDFVHDYKFTIAFENSSFVGYTTEKILHPIIARSVPIYWGNPVVGRDYNTNAFIDCTGYEDNIEQIIEKIIELDTNDDLYLKMLKEEPMSERFNTNESKDLEEFFVNIINKGNNPYNKDPRNWAKRMSVDHMSRREKIRYFLCKEKRTGESIHAKK